MRHAAAVLSVLAVLTAGCGTAARPAGPASRPVPYIGFTTQTTASLRLLEQRTGVRPDITSVYVLIGGQFPVTTIRADLAAGIMPVIQLDPPGSAYTVTSGAYDWWLRAAARAIGRSHVAVGFAHEFSNPYWPWSYNHETPAAFTQAWRRIVGIFRAAGAVNVAWTWTLSNMSGPGSAQLAPYWPGAAYVTWVGIDAYFLSAADTFAGIIRSDMVQVRRLTADPVLLTETGASPASGRPRAIGSLFAGAENTPGVLGFIWFDYDKYPGQDWVIDNDPAALAAFRADASRS